MPFYSEDLRLVKTNKAINDAFFSLLSYQNFRKITVRNICEQAIISRATFYSHYSDKYDLLKAKLFSMKPHDIVNKFERESIIKENNRIITDNKTLINNILSDPDDETLEILFDFIIFLFNKEQVRLDETDMRNTVFINFLAGGVLHYLSWHVKNRYPFDVWNQYFCEILEKLIEWQGSD